MKKKYIGIGIAVLVLLAAGITYLALEIASISGNEKEPHSKAGTSSQSADASNSKNPNVRTGKNDATPQKLNGKKKVILDDEEYLAKLSEKERQAVVAMQEALDGEDFDAVLAAGRTVGASSVAEARQGYVDALGWFGERALPELTPMMGDPDEDVAQSAMEAWRLALSEIESAKERVNTAVLALSTITDEDALTMIGGEFSSAATEYIDSTDNETLATSRRVEVIQKLVDMIEGGKLKNSKSAATIYEDITGHEWMSIEEAEKYIQNPDDYEPPEEQEPEEPPEEPEEPNADQDDECEWYDEIIDEETPEESESGDVTP